MPALCRFTQVFPLEIDEPTLLARMGAIHSRTLR
jgi:hypothetical protein